MVDLLYVLMAWPLYLLFRSAPKAPANEKKERPLSTMSEASNYTGSSDYAAQSSSPAGRVSDTHAHSKRKRKSSLYSSQTWICLCQAHLSIHSFSIQPSRPSKKIHNFGKRSNSIRRNPSAPIVKSNWLYKQVSEDGCTYTVHSNYCY